MTPKQFAGLVLFLAALMLVVVLTNQQPNPGGFSPTFNCTVGPVSSTPPNC